MTTVNIEDNTRKYWTDLRVFTAKTGESGVPAASGFVSLDWSGTLPEEIEVRMDPITTTGSPDFVIFTLWRYLGGKVDKISTISTALADVAVPVPAVVRFDGDSLYTTVSFTNGTTPTATTTVQYRVIK